MSTPTSGSTPAQEVEKQALSKVHQFFDEIESKAKNALGILSSDAQALLAKLRNQVHQDVQLGTDQVKQDITQGSTDVQQAVAPAATDNAPTATPQS
jgi:gas vesicle protein